MSIAIHVFKVEDETLKDFLDELVRGLEPDFDLGAPYLPHSKYIMYTPEKDNNYSKTTNLPSGPIILVKEYNGRKKAEEKLFRYFSASRKGEIIINQKESSHLGLVHSGHFMDYSVY